MNILFYNNSFLWNEQSIVSLALAERFKKHKITAVGNNQAIRLAVSRQDVDHIYPGE